MIQYAVLIVEHIVQQLKRFHELQEKDEQSTANDGKAKKSIF